MIQVETINNYLREADIEGFIQAGAPDDEYTSEAEDIVQALNELTADQLTGGKCIGTCYNDLGEKLQS